MSEPLDTRKMILDALEPMTEEEKAEGKPDNPLITSVGSMNVNISKEEEKVDGRNNT